MKITHISTFADKGGAAKSALRIHNALLEWSINSRFLSLYSEADSSPTMLTYNYSDSFWTRLKRRIRFSLYNRWMASIPHDFVYDTFSPSFSPFTDILAQLPESDIIQLHWAARFVDIESFLPNAVKKAPVVWRLSDMHLLTGGCHYDNDCGKYKTMCSTCPQLNSTKVYDKAFIEFDRKRKVFEKLPQNRFFLIAQSEWMANKIKESPFLGRFETRVIPNGANSSIFRSDTFSRKKVRSELQIADHEFVILFVSSDVDNQRKGFGLLHQALEKASHTMRCIVVGKNQDEPLSQDYITYTGELSSEKELAAYYNAADLFVFPSLHDNFPNTVLESLMCGTPVLGCKNSGGGVELIDENNGILVNKDSDSILEGIRYVSNNMSYSRNSISKLTHDTFTIQEQVKKLVEYYQHIMSYST